MRIFLIILKVLQMIYAPIFLMIGVLIIKENFFLSLAMIFGSSVWLLHIFKSKVSVPVKLQPFLKKWYLIFFPMLLIGIIFAPNAGDSDQTSNTESVSQLTSSSSSKITKTETVTSKSSSSISSESQKNSSSSSSVSSSSSTSTSKLEINDNITITKNQNDLMVSNDNGKSIGKSQDPQKISFKVSDVKLSDGVYHLEWEPGVWSGSDPDYAYATITINDNNSNLIQIMKDEPQDVNIKSSDVVHVQMFGKGTGDTLKLSK